MGLLCSLCDETKNSIDNETNYENINSKYKKVHISNKNHILININNDKKIWVLVKEKDFIKYLNNSGDIVKAICLEDNNNINLKKGKIIDIIFNFDLCPTLFLQK
tara:strand:- start:566 stop:880 length:315 start_codon:yes stop_codon:yes gene_type:complete